MITTTQLKAVQKLKNGIAFHDSFGAVPDDCGVMIEGPDSFYELADEFKDGRLQLGHLRDILSFFQDEGFI